MKNLKKLSALTFAALMCVMLFTACSANANAGLKEFDICNRAVETDVTLVMTEGNEEVYKKASVYKDGTVTTTITEVNTEQLAEEPYIVTETTDVYDDMPYPEVNDEAYSFKKLGFMR